MRLMDFFQSLGDKLGILEMAHGRTPQSPARIQTRTVTLAELTTEIRSEEVRALADRPAELTIPFDKIFETAGIKAGAVDWTVDKLRHILLSDQFKGQARDAVQKRILETLQAENVAAEDIVKDAIARDKVLDSFELYARKKMEERRAARERKTAELEENIQQLQGELAELKDRRRADEEKWDEWRQQKKALERDMAWTIGYLIDRPVITMTDE